MRAEIAIRNVVGIFSGNCPHCSRPVLSDICCGDEFSCVHCSGNIEIQNYGENFLLIQAKVKLLPKVRSRAKMINPDDYMGY